VAHFTTWNGSATRTASGQGLGHDGVDEVRAIRADVGDLGAPVRTEQVEELAHRGTGTSRSGHTSRRAS